MGKTRKKKSLKDCNHPMGKQKEETITESQLQDKKKKGKKNYPVIEKRTSRGGFSGIRQTKFNKQIYDAV